MATDTKVLLNPSIKTLVRMSDKDREEISWYAEMGMPISGTVVRAVRRVLKVRKEMK